MKWVFALLVVIAALTVGLAIWARQAPSDAARWHAMPGAVTDRDMAVGAMRVVGAGEAGLSTRDPIIRAEPRTTVLAPAMRNSMASSTVVRPPWPMIGTP